MAPITVVVDRENSATCATAVSTLACLAHARVVCHPTPGGRPAWLGCDLLLALGKRVAAIRAEHIRTSAWELAAVWLRAEAVEHLFVARAQTLRVEALKRLGALQQRTGIHLWLVCSSAGLTTMQHDAFGAGQVEKLSFDTRVRGWRQMARACRAQHVRPPAEVYPLVPTADFPVFRAMCRRVLDPASFAVVDHTFTTALAKTLGWLGTQRDVREHFRSLELELDDLEERIPRTQYILDREIRVRNELSRGWYEFQREANNQLNVLTASACSPSETLVRLRAAQAAYFRFGLLLQVRVPPPALRGSVEFGPTCDVTIADRLRGLCTPALAAAAALALALHLGPHALASLRIGEIAPSGTRLELLTGERRLIPAHTSALVRAQLIQRRDHGARNDDPLFIQRHGAPASEATLRRLLQQVSRRLALSIPSIITPTAASVSWLVGHHLNVNRLPVFPLRARQWASV